MATRNVSLTDGLDRFIEERVDSGDFQNASEVVRAGLRLLKAQSEEDERKVERLRLLLREAEGDLAAGRCVDVSWDELDGWLDSVGRPAR